MPSSRFTSLSRMVILLAGLALADCASSQEIGNSNIPVQEKGVIPKDSVQGKGNPRDPLEPYNRSMYQFNEGVDKAILKPLAKTYNYLFPEPVRKMVSNFFSNLNDIRTTFNDLLQLKLDQAGSDASRVVFNSTFGILGLFDVADHLEKHDEDFGQTLGYWGVKSGPYFVLPLLGPRNIRDTVGFVVDIFTNLNPIGWLNNVPTRNTLYGSLTVDQRAGMLKNENILEEAAIDRYAFIRDGYMQKRQNLVYDGNPPREKFDDEEFDDKEEKNLPDGASTPADTSAPGDTSTPADSSDNSQEAKQPTAGGVSIFLTLPGESEQPAQPAATDAAESSDQSAAPQEPAAPSFNPYRIEPLTTPDREGNSLPN